MSQQTRSTFVLTHPTEILAALVGLKDVGVLALRTERAERRNADRAGGRATSAARLRWSGPGQRAPGGALRRPSRLRGGRCAFRGRSTGCAVATPTCQKKTWVLEDHRIAAKNCLLTTRAAKWATVQVGGGQDRLRGGRRARLRLAHRQRRRDHLRQGAARGGPQGLNKTTAIGLDETSFVEARLQQLHGTTPPRSPTWRTTRSSTSCPSRNFAEVAGWLDKQPRAWKERIRFGALDMSATYAAVYSVVLPRATQVVDSFHAIALANRASTPSAAGCRSEQTRPPGPARRPALSGTARPARGRREARRRGDRAPRVTARARRSRMPRWPSPIGSKSACVTSTEPATPTRPARCSKSSRVTA